MEINRPDCLQKILIASTSSKFKQALVRQLTDAMQADDIYFKIIGLDLLARESAPDYDAVLLINTCMAWDMDQRVKHFLRNNTACEHVIVLTTSGSSQWLPKKRGAEFDAVSSASQMDHIDDLVERLQTKLSGLLAE